MENTISTLRPDVVDVQTAARPTPVPARIRFSEVLSGSARALVRGAEAAVRVLPGPSIAAVAVRGTSFSAAPEGPVAPGGGLSANGNLGVGNLGVGSLGAVNLGGVAVAGGGSGVAAGTGASPAGESGGLEGSIAQAQEMNLYYLQIQEEVNAQSRTFTALSNVLEVEHNTAKAAIGNIH